MLVGGGRGGLSARDVLRRGLDAAKERYEVLLDRLEARAPRSGYWMGDEARPNLTAWLDRVQSATRLDRAVARLAA